MKVFDKDWGFLIAECSQYNFDFLPRFSMHTSPLALEIIIGFLCFRLKFNMWSKQMQDVIKND